MDLPRSKNENLPKQHREVKRDGDAYFDPIVDPSDVINLELDPDSYYEGQHKVHEMLIESRIKLNEYKLKERHESKRNNQSSETNHQGTQD